jgi:hypothetical protein
MMGVRGTSLVGLIPRIANLLFYLKDQSPDREFHVEASYLEIYNEKLRDLLDKKGAARPGMAEPRASSPRGFLFSCR